MSEMLKVKVRESLGKRNSRRLRRSGSIPAVLYGHGQESISLTVSSEELSTALRHGSKLVELQGDVSDNALISEVQWNALGIDVLHVDLTRVSVDEKVEATIPIELRGEAPGTKEGGVIDHPVHSIQIECLVTELPEKITVSINKLNLGEAITAASLEIPDGARILLNESTTIVQCVEPVAEREEDEEVATGDSAEPEVIGRKAEEEGDES